MSYMIQAMNLSYSYQRLPLERSKKGIELLSADPKRKRALAIWLDNGLLKRFSGRIYPITVEVMSRWGSLYARLEASGQAISTMDSLIATTALAHGAVLITRDEDHFRPMGIEMIRVCFK